MQDLTFPELKNAFANSPSALLWQIPGIFLINKPSGMTSHDVVAICRKRLGLRRVGHGGTLDPLAEGLLVVLAGRATRLFDSMQDFDKEYVASFRLGERTDTQDSTGTVTERCEKLIQLTIKDIDAHLDAFRGSVLQIPPMYSALKRDGKKLVDLARKGKTVEREPRPVESHALELLDFDGTTGRLRMAVSKGFYVRTLIDDLGAALGTFAHMTALTRTRIGPFCLEQAIPPQSVQIKDDDDEIKS